MRDRNTGTVTMSKSSFDNLVKAGADKIQSLKDDHVSKAELRAWCEDKIKAVEHDMAIGLNEYECRTYILAIRRVLIDFCKVV